jgi:hypothetical protein
MEGDWEGDKERLRNKAGGRGRTTENKDVNRFKVWAVTGTLEKKEMRGVE